MAKKTKEEQRFIELDKENAKKRKQLEKDNAKKEKELEREIAKDKKKLEKEINKEKAEDEKYLQKMIDAVKAYHANKSNKQILEYYKGLLKAEASKTTEL